MVSVLDALKMLYTICAVSERLIIRVTQTNSDPPSPIPCDVWQDMGAVVG